LLPCLNASREINSHSQSGGRTASLSPDYSGPIEAKLCLWSCQKFHPGDLRICQLTGVSIHFRYATTSAPIRLEPLVNLLDGTIRKLDRDDLWSSVIVKAIKILDAKHCKVEAAELSPSGLHLAVCLEVRTLFGLRLHHVGLLHAIQNSMVIGRTARGKHKAKGWILD
jgi:hypothetical protein